jgi:DNA-directed RNA polymerase subunit M/transcription elongation factor TFIIS
VNENADARNGFELKAAFQIPVAQFQSEQCGSAFGFRQAHHAGWRHSRPSKGEMMSTTQSAQQLDLPMALDTACPKCGKEMRLSHIMPGESDNDLRTFDCVACGQVVTNSVQL